MKFKTTCLSAGLSLLLVLLLAGCQPAEESAVGNEPDAAQTPVVFTVNYPLAWIAERIGGSAIEVVFPAPAGVDPAHWQPDVETVLAYQGADRVLLNGAGYAAWILSASLSPGRLVDTSAQLGERLVPAGTVTHSHGPGGDHDHGDLASHTWLDPTLASAQADAVADSLTGLIPGRREENMRGKAGLASDLGVLDEALAKAFGGWREAGVLYSHPVYQYLDARYALDGRSLVWEPGEGPGESGWRELERLLAQRRATVMIWEDTPLATTAETLQALGIQSVVFRTGAARPADGDYLDLMNDNLKRIAGARSGAVENAH